MKVLTWHVHGSYLWYLSHIPHEWYLPVKPGGPPGFGGRAGSRKWPANVHEVPAGEVAGLDLDCVLFQSNIPYEDELSVLSSEQRRLPRVYLEHDPPRESPTDTRHPVDDPEVLVVHVTHFNQLMWDSGRSPTRVVEHGVAVPDEAVYTGELDRGVVAVNHLARRGRRLGADVFEEVRRQVPLDLVGMGSEEAGGIGEVPPPELPAFLGRYRFLFNPIRYTSLGLAVLEGMTVGVPVVGLATTEMVTAVENGISGWVHTDVEWLVARMRDLLGDRDEAARLGRGAREAALRRFSIERFSRDWIAVLDHAIATAR
ncbi:MAG TPA: glycosyltransferase [Acidimicrobiales bacterium]|nr:glycosyltransferase [Acidimicrobiales bacterium]